MSNKYKHGKYRISIAGDKKIQNKVVSITDDKGNDALSGGGAYHAAGNATLASLPTPGKDYEGFVYNMTEDFTTTADFVEGAGKSYPAGTNVAIVNAGTAQQPVYKYDVLAGDAEIDDNTVSANKTWSSQKINEQLSSPLVAPTVVDGILIKNSNQTIVTGSGTVLYYVPIKAGETIRADFKISESYSQCGLTTTLPAVDVVVSSYNSGGVGKRYYENTASADGYFCISFTKKSSIEKLEITKVNETKTIGDKVFDLEKSVKVLNEHPLRLDFFGLTGNNINTATLEVDSNSRYKIGLPTFTKTSDSPSRSFFKVELSTDGENFTTYYTRMSDDVVPQEFYFETGMATFCKLTFLNSENITVTVEKCDSYGIFDFNSREKIEVALNNMKKTVVSNGTEPLTIVHFSDIHADTANLKRIAEFSEAMKGKIDDVIHTGDIVESTADASSFDFWSAVNGTAGILNVIGNHDFNYTSGFTPTSTFEYDTYIAPYVSGWGVTQPTDAAANNRCYYYKDYTDQGVRLIVLDIRPYNQADATEKAAQKTWLETVLADAITNSLAVIVANHYPPDFQENFDTGFNTDTRVFPLWDAFAPSDWTDAVDDFMSDGGEFVCWLCGHNHKDYAGVFIKEGSTNRQVCLLVDCARMNNNSTVKYRAISTKSQDSFNVVSVNRNTKVITVMKVGNDMNYMVRPINSMAIDYEEGKLIYGDNGKADKTGVVNVSESTLTQELANNTIYNAGVLTALTITLPSTIGVDYISQVNFTSCENDQQTGNSTQFNPPQSPAPTINMDGDDINAQGQFVPVENRRYTLMFYTDGSNMFCIVIGIDIPQEEP